MPVDLSGPAVAFHRVSKHYAGSTAAVDDVTLHIDGGSFVALVGSSGSGKSTLLKMINRLAEPTGGHVTVADTLVTEQPPAILRRSIGYVFQNVGLFPHLTVAENIALPLRIAADRPTAVDRDNRVGDMLDLVDLPRTLGARLPDALSGGQRQRVGVARALVTGPRLLLLDEPFGALDPITRSALGDAVHALHHRLGLTTIMVTHDMAEALLLADRILVMSHGRIVADETPAALLAGAGGDQAQALVAVPRDQALRLASLSR